MTTWLAAYSGSKPAIDPRPPITSSPRAPASADIYPIGNPFARGADYDHVRVARGRRRHGDGRRRSDPRAKALRIASEAKAT